VILSQSKRELTTDDFELMELPKSFWKVKWSDFKNTPDLKYLERYLSRLHTAFEDGDGVFIGGPQLSGKSHLSAYIARLARSYGASVQWAPAIDIQDKIYRRDMFQDNDSDYSILERYRKVDLLVIDNLGGEIPAVRHGRNHVVELIEHRINWNKPMVINCCRDKDMDTLYHEGYLNWLLSLHLTVFLPAMPRDIVMNKYAKD